MFPIVASVPYIFYFLFLVLILRFKRFKSEKQIFLLLFFISLIVLIGYHGEYSDWRFYKGYVANCTHIGCTYFEPLYDFVTFVASKTVGFYLIPSLSFSLILFVFYRLRKYVKNNTEYFILTLSIYLVYLPLYYGALRQSIAFSFLILGFMFIFDKKYIKSFLSIMIATGFHLSSVVISFVFIVYLFIWNVSGRIYIFFIFMLIISYILGIYIMQSFSDEMAIISSFNPGTQSATVNETKLLLLPIERFVILLIAIYVLYFFRNNRLFVYMSLFSITGAIFYIVVYHYSLNTAGRVVAFFRITDVFVIYYFFKILLNKNKSLINTNNINNVALILVLVYSTVKYYFTIVSVGFFR